MANIMTQEFKRFRNFIQTRTIFNGLFSNYKNRHILNSMDNEILVHKDTIRKLAKTDKPNETHETLAVRAHHALMRITEAAYYLTPEYAFLSLYLKDPGCCDTKLARSILLVQPDLQKTLT